MKNHYLSRFPRGIPDHPHQAPALYSKSTSLTMTLTTLIVIGAWFREFKRCPSEVAGYGALLPSADSGPDTRP